MPAVCTKLADAQAVLYLLMDTDSMNSLLRTYASQGVCGMLYLVADDGTVISGDPAQQDTVAMRELALEADLSDSDSGARTIGDVSYCWQRLSGPGVLVVNRVTSSQLTQ